MGYVFISNLIASAATLLMLLPIILKGRLQYNFQLHKRILKYALPLLVAGLAGNINEAMDRVLLKHLIPEGQDPMSQLGIYGANAKIAVLMVLFIQMFRYAFEPFFFKKGKSFDSRQTYALVTKYFIIFGLFIFLGIIFYLDVIQYFIGSEFRIGLNVVPVLLLSNLFLGIFFNLSVWYKLNNLTQYGAVMASIGAAITLGLNFLLVPQIGYMGAAYTRLICFFTLVLLSYFLSRKFFPIPYPLKEIGLYFFIAFSLFGLSLLIPETIPVLSYLLKTVLLIVFIIFVESREKVIRSFINH